jgi:hypothetical protein
MRRSLTLSSVLLLGCVAALLVSSNSPATAKAATKADTQMTQYLIESPHTAEECMQALDDISGQGPKALAKWNFGCMTGDHTGWAMVSAADEQAALQMVPANLREKAHVHKLNKFTAAEIKKMHEKMMEHGMK